MKVRLESTGHLKLIYGSESQQIETEGGEDI